MRRLQNPCKCLTYENTRELSWLAFNQGALDEELKADTPLLKCIRFLVIETIETVFLRNLQLPAFIRRSLCYTFFIKR